MSGDFDHLSGEEFEELRRTYFSQSHELIEEIQDSALRLETSPEDESEMKGLKRNFHTLKGDSNSMGLEGIAVICHKIEDVLAVIDDKARKMDSNVITLILGSVDVIDRLLREAEAGGKGEDIEEATGMIDAFMGEDVPGEEKCEDSEGYSEYQALEMDSALEHGMKLFEAEIVFHPMCAEKSVGAFMVNEKARKMGQIIRVVPDDNSEEINKVDRFRILFSADKDESEIKEGLSIVGIVSEVKIKLITGPRKVIDDADQKSSRLKSEILRVEASKVDTIMDLTGELIIGRSILEQIAKESDNGAEPHQIAERLNALNTYIGKSISGLQRGIMRMRMVQINNIFRKFPRMVRELCASKDKKVRLEFYGKETELDKGIVDSLGEPLVHVIRNAIDHGLEGPAERRSVGKPEEGTIAFRAYHEAAQIIVEISDDGRGIDMDKLKDLALGKGFLDKEEIEKLTEKEALGLIFISGLSSSGTVSDISGRGIGMDAVKTAVESMKGVVEIESEKGKGTTFRFSLPLTLAVLKGLLIDVSGRKYAMPVPSIVEVGRIMSDDLVTVDGRDTLVLRDRTISMIHLDELFLLPRSQNEKKFVLILGMGNKRVGLVVDKLIGQQELVIKPVDHDFTQTDLVAGASVLGDGSVVFILDAPSIFKKAVEREKVKIAEKWKK
ncbi:MAG: chemotaxis protein CheA [Thermodesulfovibrionales bacterium]